MRESGDDFIVIHTAEVVDYTTIRGMVNASELTITGTVESIERGSRIRAEGEAPSDYIAKLVHVRRQARARPRR